MSDVRRTRIEDYLATIGQICEEDELARASSGAIARLLHVSNGTASSMLKKLAEKGLIDHLPYEGASLTAKGCVRARRVLRRRRLLELFLSETLGVTWESVEDEAWRLEPAISERLVGRMDTYLNRPEFDPHGDPIPRSDGTLPASNTKPLCECQTGATVVLQRVKKQSESVLRYLREAGMEIGAQWVLQENSTVSGVVVLQTKNGQQTLGYPIAMQLQVREIEGK